MSGRTASQAPEIETDSTLQMSTIAAPPTVVHRKTGTDLEGDGTAGCGAGGGDWEGGTGAVAAVVVVAVAVTSVSLAMGRSSDGDSTVGASARATALRVCLARYIAASACSMSVANWVPWSGHAAM